MSTVPDSVFRRVRCDRTTVVHLIVRKHEPITVPANEWLVPACANYRLDVREDLFAVHPRVRRTTERRLRAVPDRARVDCRSARSRSGQPAGPDECAAVCRDRPDRVGRERPPLYETRGQLGSLKRGSLTPRIAASSPWSRGSTAAQSAAVSRHTASRTDCCSRV